MTEHRVDDSQLRPPDVTLVVPMYNVASFLPAFLTSLSAQTLSSKRYELVFVNDGSTDDSLDLLQSWIATGSVQAITIDQQNQGLSAARNAGLARATGTWVSFPDPDDVLDPDYLSRVLSLITGEAREADLVCGHPLILNDATQTISDTHPLHRKFSKGSRVVDLVYTPENIQLQSASAFYRRERIERLGLRFDPSIRPNFEDAYFTALYLDESDHPLLGIAADAFYQYRKRVDGSSLVQQSWAQEDKYTVVLERGYLRLLTTIREKRGCVPVWVQNMVLYDLLFYFRHEQSVHGPTGRALPAWFDRFHELTIDILSHIETATIDAFSVVPTSRQLKDALIVGYQGRRQRPPSVRLVRIDAQQHIAQFRYHFGGELPPEEFWASGRLVEPAYGKIRDLSFFGRVLLHERILWLPAVAELRVFFGGRPVPLEFGRAPEVVVAAEPDATWNRLTRRRKAPASRPVPETPATPVPIAKPEPTWSVSRLRAFWTGVLRRERRRLSRKLQRRAPQALLRTRQLRATISGRPYEPQQVRPGPFADLDPIGDQRLRLLARTEKVRARYHRAWTFMDRDTEAHDNAEHLYRWVMRHRPDINAWFVLRRESADWARLKSEGFRLVPFGSGEHVLLLRHTIHLLSSQVDHYVVRPLDESRFGRRSWRFTFLQHGVTKDDLSRWVNGKPISRFVTASDAEYESIAGDHTPYIFTAKEVRLTGFPRHDRLWQLGEQNRHRDVLLIMPTWRRALMNDAQRGNARELVVPLLDSRFGRTWFEFVRSGRLQEIAHRHGLQIIVVPHPNMQAHVSGSDYPDHVRVCTYERDDVQELIARAAVLVTDYSSQAFEAAYLQRPVVYYQFDREEFFSGGHVYRQGQWSYDGDGFGPVTTRLDGALDAIGTSLANPTAEPYLSRMQAAFPFRDGRCCERVFESVIDLTQPVGRERPSQIDGDPPPAGSPCAPAEPTVDEHDRQDLVLTASIGANAGDHDMPRLTGKG